MGDFKAEISEPNLVSFCTFYNFKSLINKPTFYKDLDNPSCIDLILTNSPNYFQNSSTFETRLSLFHKLILTLFKSEIPQQRTNVLSCRIISALIARHLSVISKKIDKNTSIDLKLLKRSFLKLLNVLSSIYWINMLP